VTLTNVTIEENSLDVSGKGGGLNIDSGARVNASGLVVSRNSAFFAAGVFIGKDCSTNIDRAIITGNRADYGAGIGVFGGASPVITNSLISGNTASKWGGGLLVYTGAKATLHGVSFEKNVAELGGGAVAYTQSSFTAVASKFASNVASVSGGAIHLQTLAAVELVDSKLEDNVASLSGGGGAHITSGASLSMTGGTLSGNNASQSGGGILCEGGRYGGGNLSMTAGTAVTGNSCGTLGGGVHLTGGCLASFSAGVTFTGNMAGLTASGGQCNNEGDAGGGAVAVEPYATSGRATTLVVSECSFMDNIAPDGGGIIVIDRCEGSAGASRAQCQNRGADVRLAATIISSNKAIGCQDAATAAVITTDTVAGLMSSGLSGSIGCGSQERRGSGGGIYAASGVISLSNGTIVQDNVATAFGGGILSHVTTSLVITGRSTRVDGNAAGDTGGGVMHAGRVLRVTGGASFSHNRALDGGAVAIILSSSAAAADATAGSEPVSFEISDNITLSHNWATRRGGAFYISASMELGNLSGIALRNSTAAAGSGFYWVRAASPEAHLECRECSLWDGGDANAETDNFTTAVLRASPSSNFPATAAPSRYEPRATEALSLSFALALPAELQSAVTAPLFSVSLLDFYGQVASTEDDVVCRIEPVTSTTATSTVATPTVATNLTLITGGGHGDEAGGGVAGAALEMSGILIAASFTGVASFDKVTVGL